MEIWADAEHILSDPESEGDLGFHLKIIQSNTTIPAILVSETGRVVQHINIQIEGSKKQISDAKLLEKIDEFKTENEPIDIPIDEKTHYKVFYGKSGFSGEFGHIPFFNNEISGITDVNSLKGFVVAVKEDDAVIEVGSKAYYD